MNSDGAKFNDTLAESVWPVWLAIADLPPNFRSKYHNIVLSSVNYGRGKPDFDEVFEVFQNEISEPSVIEIGGETVTVRFQPIFLVADLTAKCAILNMKKYNGSYGCHPCEKRGMHTNGGHRYPHKKNHHFETERNLLKLFRSRPRQGKK